MTGVVFALGCSSPAEDVSSQAVALTSRLQRQAQAFSPLPVLGADPTNRVADDPAAARFGQRLFYEPGLSGVGALSCATCHPPEMAFTDGRPVAVGLGVGGRNTPTVLDSAHARWLFRDGRADTLWSQAIQPLENPVEMGGSRVGVVQHLLSDPTLRDAYSAVFGDELAALGGAGLPESARPIPGGPDHEDALAWAALSEASRDAVDLVFANVGKALAAYERLLVSGPSPFDRFAAGDGAALSRSARRGFTFFMRRAGCARCHIGPRFTDDEFHNLGIPPSDGGAPRDPGRFEGAQKLGLDSFGSTSRFSDAPAGARSLATRTLAVSGEHWGAFKTPSLRNVSRTAPYMHAGQITTLHDVVGFYSTLEGAMTGGHHAESTLTPARLTDSQIDDLVAFLKSLTCAEPPAELLGPPAR